METYAHTRRHKNTVVSSGFRCGSVFYFGGRLLPNFEILFYDFILRTCLFRILKNKASTNFLRIKYRWLKICFVMMNIATK